MHTNKADTKTPRSTPEPIRDRFPKEWTQLKSSARATFTKLTEQDVQAVNGRYDELSSRLGKAYGYDQDRVDTEIQNFMSKGSSGQVMTATNRTQAAATGSASAKTSADKSPPVAKH